MYKRSFDGRRRSLHPRRQAESSQISGRVSGLRGRFRFLRSAGRIFLFAVSLTLCGAAAAQDAATHDAATDFALSPPLTAVSPPLSQPAAAPSKDFRLIFTLPLLGTSNAAGAISERTGASGSPDTHANPDLLLRWTHQFDFVRLSASADVAFDRYATSTDQSSDTLTGGFKAALTDGRSDLFVPYVAYTGIVDYEPGFVVRDDTMHNFTLGFTSGIGIGAGGAVIPFRESSGVGDWSVAFDLSFGRRLANPRDFQSVFATFVTDVVYNFSSDVHFGFLSKVRFRDYDSYYGESRRDTFVAFQARVELTPEWLTQRLPGTELDLAVEFQRNMSTLETARYTRWEAGPALILTRRF